jgi:predicted ribosomally synthesized peptide with SipW-like signal peptide
MSIRKTLPIGTIFILLVIALALVGVGYAFWSETLTISGTVTTGEVDVQFSTYEPVECVDTQAGLCQPEPSEKAAAANCTVAWLGPDADSNGDSGYDQMAVTVTGMYPGYHCKVSFDVTSTGNVPVHVELPKPVGVIPVWVATNFVSCYTNNVQLEQDQSTGVCTLDIAFTNATAPDENSGPYTFGWTILAKQWNEEPPLPPIYVLSNTFNYNGAGGWAGWSCPTGTTLISGGYLPATAAVANSLAWIPGASIGAVIYPFTPWEYVYSPPEEGWIVQDGGDSGNLPTNIFLWCQP